MPLKIRPLTPDRWPDLVDLFGPERGANSGCWCMWPRVVGREWNALGKDGRKRRFAEIVKEGPPPGLLAYDGDMAIGWVAVGPRPSVARFNASKISHPRSGEADPDPDKIYAITCFFSRPGHRKNGLMQELAKAAANYAHKRGAQSVEACAIEPDKPLQWGEGFVGLASVFRRLGFSEVTPLSQATLDEARFPHLIWQEDASIHLRLPSTIDEKIEDLTVHRPNYASLSSVKRPK